MLCLLPPSVCCPALTHIISWGSDFGGWTDSHWRKGREKKTRLDSLEEGRKEGRKEGGEEEEMEKAKKKSVIRRAVVFWIVIAFSIFVDSVACSSSSSIDDKCGACNAVAEELEIGLSKEKPRNHLDMRHRLDSKGQREGKVIDYRVSDLRVVDLLDGLCENMQEYTLEKLDSTRREWIKVANWDRLNIDKQEARAHSKQISSYCGSASCNSLPLLEETEDELAELIKKGSVKIGGVSKVLCQDLSHHCSKTSTSPQIRDEDDDDDSYRDL